MVSDEQDVLAAMQDLLDVAVCQVCGRASIIEMDVVRHWLVSPKRGDNPYGLLIIRCPHHISEWAMRQSVAGRTDAMRDRASRGRKQTLLPQRWGTDPFPSRFRGAQTKGATDG